jgi:hypothetical protein
VNVTAPANLTASLSGLITDLCQTNSGSITVNAAGGVVNGVTPGATTPAGSGNGYDVTWTVTSPFLNGFAGPSNINPATSPQLITTDPGTKVFTQMSGNTQFNFVVTDDNGCVVQ